MGKRVKILRETMKAAEDGCYFVEEREVKIPVSFEQIKEVTLYAPEQVAQLSEQDTRVNEPTRIKLRNQDTLEAAFELHQRRKDLLPGNGGSLALLPDQSGLRNPGPDGYDPVFPKYFGHPEPGSFSERGSLPGCGHDRIGTHCLPYGSVRAS